MTHTGALTFVKSSWSTGNGGDCVEWAFTPAGVQVRDSKDRLGTQLHYTLAEWDQLTATAATGATHPSVTTTPHGTRLTGQGSELNFTPTEWHAFTLAARHGETRHLITRECCGRL
ncbi:MAG TPA: DUF397 domain-containing protein [Pseudonocardia sp.]|uniref:DUF397 domain-containing protein n=1 Tax=Pseudonocardia sp. TaxID=60912 RepID=UPI002F3F7237